MYTSSIQAVLNPILQIMGLRTREPIEQAEPRDMPQELLSHIFTYLSSPEDLSNASCVNNTWKILAFDDKLWSVFLKVIDFKLIDVTFWENHVDIRNLELFRDREERPATIEIDRRVLTKIMYTKVEGDAGVTFLTIPQGLTIRKLQTIARLHNIKFTASMEGLDEPIAQTYTVLITNGPLAGSEGQQERVQQRRLRDAGGEVAKTIEVAALCILTYINSARDEPVRLYSKGNYTKTLERTMTGFCFDGFSISDSLDHYSFAVGTGAVQRFEH